MRVSFWRYLGNNVLRYGVLWRMLLLAVVVGVSAVAILAQDWANSFFGLDGTGFGILFIGLLLLSFMLILGVLFAMWRVNGNKVYALHCPYCDEELQANQADLQHLRCPHCDGDVHRKNRLYAQIGA